MISKEDGLIPNLITKSGASFEDLRAKTEAAISALPKVSGMQADKLYISRELDAAFTEAEAHAKKMKNEFVSVEHLKGIQAELDEMLRLQAILVSEITEKSLVKEETLRDYITRKAEWYIPAKEAIAL